MYLCYKEGVAESRDFLFLKNQLERKVRQEKRNPHIPRVLEILEDISGLRVRQVPGSDILITAYPRKHLDLEDIFQGVQHHLKSQMIEFRSPTPSVVRRRLAPKVTTVRAVAGEETPPTVNLWFRLPSKGDRAHLEVETSNYLDRRWEVVKRRLGHQRSFDPSKLVTALDRRFVGGFVIPALSRIPFVQHQALR